MKRLPKKSLNRYINNIVIFTLFFIPLFSCNKDDGASTSNIKGTWQLIEIYSSDGGSPGAWYPVENGYTYSFKDNDIITSNKFSCNGVYIFNSSVNINITFDCPEAGSLGDYDITFENGNLILTPNPTSCDEGCAEKFKRLEE